MRELKTASYYEGNNSWAFPDEDSLTQSQRRDPQYYLSCVNAICSRYINNFCYYPYNAWLGLRSFTELRAYRAGRNDPNKYKGYIMGRGYAEVNKALSSLGEKRDGKPEKTNVNISWDVLQALPDKMETVMGFLQKIKYDRDISAVDYQSLIGKKTSVAMAKMFADEQYSFFNDKVNEAAGRQVLKPVEASQMPGGTQFSNPKEVDIAAAVGVFFLEQEAAMQSLLSKTDEDSVSDVVNDHCKEDICTLAVAGKRIYCNQNTNMVMEDYVDPALAMIPHSVYKDYRDITWAGEIKTYTIGRLRKELNIEESELIKIAKSYAGKSGGYREFYYNIQRARNNVDFGMNMMDQIEVDVADCAWYGYKDSMLTSITRRDEGNLAINQVDENYKLSSRDEREGKKLNTFRSRTVYRAKVVMGTSYVFDYGEEKHIAYKRNDNGGMEPIFPYVFSRTGSVSLVEKCIGFVDDANLANYKLRVARMKMPAPPNLFIDKSMLENVVIDQVKWSPMKLMRLLQEEGFLIGDSKNQWGQNTGAAKPVNPIGTDVIMQLKAWIDDRDNSLAMIDRLTVNEAFSAQSPDPRQAVGVNNALIQGAQNKLTPIIKTFQYLVEAADRVKISKWQVVASYMPEEQRKRLSINRALKVVHIGTDFQDYDFDLKVHAAINEQEKAEMLQDIKDMRNLRRQAGAGGINEADYILLYNMVKSGKLVQAQLVLSQIIEARTKEDAAKQAQLTQMNQQMQMESTNQAAQNEGKLNQQESDNELRNKDHEIKTKAEMELRVQSALEALRHINAIKEKAIENVYGNHQHRKSA